MELWQREHVGKCDMLFELLKRNNCKIVDFQQFNDDGETMSDQVFGIFPIFYICSACASWNKKYCANSSEPHKSPPKLWFAAIKYQILKLQMTFSVCFAIKCELANCANYQCVRMCKYKSPTNPFSITTKLNHILLSSTHKY